MPVPLNRGHEFDSAGVCYYCNGIEGPKSIFEECSVRIGMPKSLPANPVPFKRAAVKSSRPDATGKVVVKVYLQDPCKLKGFPVQGNLKYEVELDAATVGAVQAVIERVLFGDGIVDEPSV